MTTTRQQFASCAPSATPETVDALFALNSDNQPTIHRILAEAGITEPAVVAQFLTCAHLASNGFTNFEQPVYGLSAIDWLSARAREWFELKCTEMALEWDWRILVNVLDVKWAMEYMDWPQINETLADICAVLGIEDQSNNDVLEDRGASEM